METDNSEEKLSSSLASVEAEGLVLLLITAGGTGHVPHCGRLALVKAELRSKLYGLEGI